jgi:hypothetical protein
MSRAYFSFPDLFCVFVFHVKLRFCQMAMDEKLSALRSEAELAAAHLHALQCDADDAKAAARASDNKAGLLEQRVNHHSNPPTAPNVVLVGCRWMTEVGLFSGVMRRFSPQEKSASSVLESLVRAVSSSSPFSFVGLGC